MDTDTDTDAAAAADTGADADADGSLTVRWTMEQTVLRHFVTFR